MTLQGARRAKNSLGKKATAARDQQRWITKRFHLTLSFTLYFLAGATQNWFLHLDLKNVKRQSNQSSEVPGRWWLHMAGWNLFQLGR